MRAGATKLSSIALAIVLLVVGATSGWAVLSIRSAVAELAEATDRLGAYAQLQRAVAEEAFSEAGYRRAPGAAARIRVSSSVVAVNEAVAAVRRVGDRSDEAVLSYVILTNERYAAEVATSLDATTEPGRDDRVAGPALDSIQALLDGAVEGHRADVRAAEERQLDLTDALIIVFPVVIGASFLGLALCWRLLVREQRLLLARSADSEHRSLHDPLTGLANRRLFNDSLVRALGRTRSTGTVLFFIDLDNFKEINDNFGHDAGDQVLVAVSDRLSASVRGDLVARLGGDEFAILLQSVVEPEAVAQRVLETMEAPIDVDGEQVTASASIGIAEAPKDGTTARQLLRSADEALYAAKAGGKGRAARRGPAASRRQALGVV